MTGLFYNTGEVFQLYSIGDGPYMASVLNAVAMLSNSNVLITLGALGLAFGLIMTGFRAVSTGLERTGIPMLFVSFLVFVMMFGMRANVVVNDLSDAPGTAYGAVYPVDNVPFGLAFIGHFISASGLYLTEDMEQAFSVPGGSDPNGLLGFGRSLEMLNAVRRWNDPGLGSGAENIAITNSLRNQESYIANCTMAGVKLGKLDFSLAQTVPKPWVMGSLTTGGLGFNNNFITFPFVGPSGIESDFPCGQGLTQVANDTAAQSTDVFAAFLQALPSAAPNGTFAANGTDAENQVNNAASLIGLSQTQLQQYTSAASTAVAEHIAVAAGGSGSPADIMAATMLQQAQQQRDTQWSADESMFRSVARPMTAFFESMIYAVAPFMALLIGFGAWGLQMVMRYCILTIWVMLWLPVMAICNLFEVTLAQQGIKALTDAAYTSAMGGGAAPFGSISNSLHLQQVIENWISVGALLAASTPAITLMLIFGGAMTATNLASRLNTGEKVNEKQLSPDADRPGAALDVQPLATTNPMTGTTATSAPAYTPKYNWSTDSSEVMASQSQRMHTAAQQYVSSADAMLSSSMANNSQAVNSAMHSKSIQGTASQQYVGNWVRSNIQGLQNTGSFAASMMTSAAMSGNIPLVKKLLSAQGITDSKVQEQIASQLQKSVGQQVTTNQSFGVQVADATQDSIQSLSSRSSTFSQQASGDRKYQAANREMDQARTSYTATKSLAAKQGVAQQTNAAAVGHYLATHRGANGESLALADSALARRIDPVAFEKAQAAVAASNWGLHGEEALGAATVMALSGQFTSQGTESADQASQRGNAFLSVLAQSSTGSGQDTLTGAPGMAANASSNSNVASNASRANGTDKLVLGKIRQAPRAPGTASSVMGAGNARLSGADGSKDASANTAVVGNAGTFNANQGGLSDAQNASGAGVGALQGTSGARHTDAVTSDKDHDVDQEHAAQSQAMAAGAAASAVAHGQNAIQVGLGGAEVALGAAFNSGGPKLERMRQVTGNITTADPADKAGAITAATVPEPGHADSTPSMITNATNPSTIAKTNDLMTENQKRLEANPRFRNASQGVKYIVAAYETMNTAGGMTPQMFRGYELAQASLTPAEQNYTRAVEEGGGDPNSGVVPSGQSIGGLNGAAFDNTKSAIQNEQEADSEFANGTFNPYNP